MRILLKVERSSAGRELPCSMLKRLVKSTNDKSISSKVKTPRGFAWSIKEPVSFADMIWVLRSGWPVWFWASSRPWTWRAGTTTSFCGYAARYSRKRSITTWRITGGCLSATSKIRSTSSIERPFKDFLVLTIAACIAANSGLCLSSTVFKPCWSTSTTMTFSKSDSLPEYSSSTRECLSNLVTLENGLYVGGFWEMGKLLVISPYASAWSIMERTRFNNGDSVAGVLSKGLFLERSFCWWLDSFSSKMARYWSNLPIRASLSSFSMVRTYW